MKMNSGYEPVGMMGSRPSTSDRNCSAWRFAASENASASINLKAKKKDQKNKENGSHVKRETRKNIQRTHTTFPTPCGHLPSGSAITELIVINLKGKKKEKETTAPLVKTNGNLN